MSKPTLSEALKEHSRTTHDAVDHLVMSMQPFANHDNYRKFLQAQFEFHKTVHPIYQNQKLASQFDDLAQLSRLDRVKSDMKDLAVEAYDKDIEQPSYDEDEAVGWLYCVEGSNVGAAILYKEAGKIDLTDDFGASHLAAHADGRMPHWRSVKAKIDALPFDEQQRQAAMKGADDAFAYFKRLIRQIYETE
ncbi:biliverdin-producing heme oxygenase [Moraxella sp. Tifton1]|uniref:biliverdin-producing heme oxygenase n=1 Tax=Moraxella oculi TaxID=2940516 RepID=UPI0020121B2F|nr:biliverdin-producing heme oxygenase [Moraxella sp. Tifton1]MCL1623725.1 biliverdin-producing heme oxygenase [Moraxella sp. Tifton1]